MAYRPFIGITMGDPSGIGPEIIIKALNDPALCRLCRAVVLGDPGILESAGTDRVRADIVEIAHPHEARALPGVIHVIPTSSLDTTSVTIGKGVPLGGKAMMAAINQAVDLALEGELDGMVTCPINKALMHEAGFHYEGHTQYIAERTQTEHIVMMLAGGDFRVALATIHCALREVPSRLDRLGLYRTITTTAKALQLDFAIFRPRIAVAALNPHGGEERLFGSEEETLIRPAVKMARSEDIRVDGPFPADTLFQKVVSGHYDAVVAMYHDQGLIPLKLLHFSNAVNVTLGLPIIRTSVDHGTAYDIAGKGIADPSSLKAAIRMAVILSTNRKLRHGQ
jgi:4-hydroxythreonine-4-phosphate dehydrogenase